MRTTTSVQIGFKVPPEVAEQLDAISRTDGRFHRMSRSLIAKELVLAALAGSPGQFSSRPKPSDPIDPQPAVREEDADSYRAETEDIMQDFLATVDLQNRFFAEFRQVLDQITLLRKRDIPVLRDDIRVATAAVLRQGGASIDEIAGWITENLGLDPGEGEQDAQHSANS